jgi:hypothetical protein
MIEAQRAIFVSPGRCGQHETWVLAIDFAPVNMEECGMEAVLKNLQSDGDLEAAVEGYVSLPSHEKVDLLEKIRGSKTERVALFLSKVLDRTTEREVQKSIKRLLFTLKTQGIRVEEPKISGESALKKIESVREQKAFLSNYDPENTRVVLLAFEMKKRQFVFIHAILHFSKGLQELAAIPISRDELETVLKDYRRRMERPMVLLPIAPRYASYLIEEASNLSGTHTDELRNLKPLMTGLKGPVQKSDDIYTLPVPQQTRPKSPQAILSDPILEPFILTWESIEADRKELDAVVNPSIVLPPYVVEERRQLFINGLLQGEKLKAVGRSLKRMLEDYAYLFYAAEEFPSFKGVAEGLRDDKFFEDALLFFVKKSLEKKEEKQLGVLVDPFKQNPLAPPYPPRR